MYWTVTWVVPRGTPVVLSGGEIDITKPSGNPPPSVIGGAQGPGVKVGPGVGVYVEVGVGVIVGVSVGVGV